jgi:hypothetical protein
LRELGGVPRGNEQVHLASRIIFAAAAVVLAGSAAHAQATTTPTDYTLFSVLDRPRPDFAPLGFRVGSFIFYPSLISSVAYDDNIFATKTNRRSDVVTRLTPSFLLRSDWSVHSLEFTGAAEGVLYGSHTKENQLNAALGMRGVLDIRRDLKISYNAGWTRAHEERGTGDALLLGSAFDKPVTYDTFAAGASVNKQFNRLYVAVGAGVESRIYQDSTINGVPFDQSPRDYTAFTAKGRVGYDISPMTSIFTELAYERRQYRAGPFDSNGVKAVAGVKMEASRLVNGEAYVGYLGRFYDNSGISNINTLTYGANVNWLVTPLMTVTFLGERNGGDSVTVGPASSYIQSLVGTRVDYEVMRNLVVSGRLGYEWDDYSNPNRHDRFLKLGASTTYYINRHFQASLDYRYIDRMSSISAINYNRNIFGASLRTQF